eukprot:6473068-Amphidinium_carterae.1
MSPDAIFPEATASGYRDLVKEALEWFEGDIDPSDPSSITTVFAAVNPVAQPTATGAEGDAQALQLQALETRRKNTAVAPSGD